MNAQTIIERACSEGLIVTLAENGNIKARGDHEVVIRWQPLLKQHKEEIVNLLRSKGPGEVVQAFRPILPKWCRADCLGLEIIPLPNEGPVTGCVNPFTESWRRLDWMTECPAMVSTAIRPILPSLSPTALMEPGMIGLMEPGEPGDFAFLDGVIFWSFVTLFFSRIVYRSGPVLASGNFCRRGSTGRRCA